MKRIFSFILLSIYLCTSLIFIDGDTTEPTLKNILVVHSYNQGFPWDDEFHRGITEGLDNSAFTIYTEYLDSYRQKNISQNKIDIISSYSKMDLLCIVVTDNPAYDVLMELREEFFPDVPIFFAGLNGYESHDLPDNRVTGIAQNTSFDAFFDWIKTQMPYIENVLICGANTGTTKGVMTQVQETLAHKNYDFNIQLIVKDTYEEQLVQINTYNKTNTILYIAGSFGILNHDQYTNMLSTNSELPTFCGVRTSIVGNVIGGYVVDPYEHGKILNEYIIRLNENDTVESLPFIGKPVEKIVFNYNGLKKFNLLSATFPTGTSIINAPQKNIILTSSGLTVIGFVFAFLLLLVVGLMVILRITKQSQFALAKINRELLENKTELEAYSEELLASQEELTNQYNMVVESTAKIQEFIDFDKITGLYNDHKFYSLFELKFKEVPNYAFLYLSVANLDSLSFTHGKRVYENLLINVSQFLKSLMGPDDLIGITGNNHFLIATKLPIYENCQLLNRIDHYFSTPLYNDNYTIMLTYKLGIVKYPEIQGTTNTLVMLGSLAITPIFDNPLLKVSFYTPEIQERLILENSIQNEIETALGMEQFLLYFQPKFDLTGKILTGLEALIRWNHPDGTLKTPGYFINIAEQSGQILQIGRWVIEEVCKTLSKYRSIQVPISLNLSGQHFTNQDLIKDLDILLNKYNVSPSLIEIEITETSLVTNQTYCSMILNDLREQGFTIALDDFGTGYASISYIKNFPIDRIKIDQTFTSKITDPKFESLIKTMIQLAQELNFQVTVEGIETVEQYEIIKKYYPQELQGYLFSRPVPIDNILEL